MNYGVAFHRENFHKWLDSHAYEVLKKEFSKGNYSQIESNS